MRSTKWSDTQVLTPTSHLGLTCTASYSHLPPWIGLSKNWPRRAPSMERSRAGAWTPWSGRVCTSCGLWPPWMRSTRGTWRGLWPRMTLSSKETWRMGEYWIFFAFDCFDAYKAVVNSIYCFEVDCIRLRCIPPHRSSTWNNLYLNTPPIWRLFLKDCLSIIWVMFMVKFSKWYLWELPRPGDVP